jgi:predicted CoA-binding protein
LIELLKDKNNSIALIGASTNKNKFGYKILTDLVSKDYDVIPVNNKEVEIEGRKVFKTVQEISDCPSIINFVVPPSIGFKITKDLVEKGYDNFWYQPGAESAEISEYLDSNRKNYIDDKCIMVVSNLIDKY